MCNQHFRLRENLPKGLNRTCQEPSEGGGDTTAGRAREPYPTIAAVLDGFEQGHVSLGSRSCFLEVTALSVVRGGKGDTVKCVLGVGSEPASVMKPEAYFYA